MRIFFVIYFWICVTGLAQGQGIKFFQGSFGEALDDAKKQDKLLFVDVYADWCGPCKMMSEQIFSLKEVGEYFNERFICYQLNTEFTENKNIVQKYQIQGLPTLLFLTPNGQVVAQYLGVANSDFLLRLGQVATKEQKTPDELYNMYRKNKKDFSIHQMILTDAPYFMSEIGLEQMINQKDFNILTMFHDQMETGDVIFDFMVNHWSQYVAVVDSLSVGQYLTALHSNYIIELARRGKQDYRKILERMQGDMRPIYALLVPDVDKYSNMYRIVADANYTVYSEKNVANYIKLMDSYLDLSEKPQPNDYAMAVETLFNGLKGKLSKEGYEKCLVWLDIALKFDIPENMQVGMVMTVGDCFWALGNKEKAKESYNQAYMLTLKSKNQQFVIQMQQVLKQKLSQLE